MQQILLHFCIFLHFFLQHRAYQENAASFSVAQHAHYKTWKQRPPAMFNAISSLQQFTVCPLPCDTSTLCAT